MSQESDGSRTVAPAGRLLSLGCGFKGFLSFVGAAVRGSGVMLLFGLGAVAVP